MGGFQFMPVGVILISFHAYIMGDKEISHE